MQVEFQGPCGRLIGVLELPDREPWAAAVVCHPHPAHGGSMRNSIVVRSARALRAAGLATLRFNFRGVEGSEGVHDGVREIDDVSAAARLLSGRFPGLPLWGAGYSFGSRMVAELATRDQGLERLVLIAFPCTLYDPRFLTDLLVPGLIVMGAADRFGTAADLLRVLGRIPPNLELVEIAEADHFFRGKTPLVEAAVLRYARGTPDRRRPDPR